MKIYNIEPVAKPRMTRQDKWLNPPQKYRGKEWPRPVVKKYRQFENQVIAAKLQLPQDGAHVIFRIPMPQSWSDKKKTEMHGPLHKQLPELDNLLNAISLAVYRNDAVISDVWVTKVWD